MCDENVPVVGLGEMVFDYIKLEHTSPIQQNGMPAVLPSLEDGCGAFSVIPSYSDYHFA